MTDGMNRTSDTGSTAPSGWIVLALGNSFGQPVVLLHGFMQDEHSWDTCAHVMAGDYYLSMPRMSVSTPEDATLEALAEKVYGVVQQAILHTGCERVALVGYSMGGRIALEYARRYPETLSALVLESAGIGPVDEEDRAHMRELNGDMAQRVREAASMDEVVDYWETMPLFDTQAQLPEDAREHLRSMRKGCDQRALELLLEHAASHKMPLAEQTRQMLRELGIPVLYVAGMLDHKYTDIAVSLGDCGVQPVLLECGHCVHLEKPLEFSNVVTGFLDHVATMSN